MDYRESVRGALAKAQGGAEVADFARELSDRLGRTVTPNVLYKWRSPKSGLIPDADVLVAAADIGRQSLDELLGRDVPPPWLPRLLEEWQAAGEPAVDLEARARRLESAQQVVRQRKRADG